MSNVLAIANVGFSQCSVSVDYEIHWGDWAWILSVFVLLCLQFLLWYILLQNFICSLRNLWYTVPSHSSNVENLLEMSDKAKLSDHDTVLLINALTDKLQNADLKHSVAWTQVWYFLLHYVVKALLVICLSDSHSYRAHSKTVDLLIFQHLFITRESSVLKSKCSMYLELWKSGTD